VSDELARVLEVVCGNPRYRALSTCPPAVPFAPHVALFRAAEAHAQRLGLRLPAFTLRWAYGGAEATQHGETAWGFADGRIVVTMNADLVYPVDVLSTSLHELQHVADAGHRFDRLELERRAIAFAARALAQWR
jgi:hypothetical protein